MPVRWRGTVTLALLVPLMTACGSGSTAPQRAASRFAEAVSSGRAAVACSLLAPETKSQLEQSEGKKCLAAILDEDLPEADAVEDSSRFGTMAQVVFGGDVMFLADFPSGWKVVAAGCSAVPGQPYECQLQGG
jgi:hypothetical protein